MVAVEAGPQDGVPVVAVDQYRGARLATEHLLALGHATVHHLAGPDNWIEAQHRVKGWRDALDEAGAPRFAPLRGDWSPHSGYQLGQKLLDTKDLTAVFAANDQMALGFLRLAHERGRAIPGDVSVVGFDDIPEAEFFTPPLTTVRQDFTEMGPPQPASAARARSTRGTRSQERVTVPATLIERASTAPPKR